MDGMARMMAADLSTAAYRVCISSLCAPIFAPQTVKIRIKGYQMNHTDTYIEQDTLEVLDHYSHIIVYNDDVNTFDHVIDCFVEILGHDAVQSEQLAVLIHFKGKASVKRAPLDELRPMKDALVSEGLSAVIEQYT